MNQTRHFYVLLVDMSHIEYLVSFLQRDLVLEATMTTLSSRQQSKKRGC